MNHLKTPLIIFINSLIYVIYFFSLPHHLRTFFSPFKRVTTQGSAPGFNLQELGEVLSYNLVSIGMGIIMRTGVIILGLLTLLLFAAVGFVILLTTFLTSPLWLPLSLWQDAIKRKEIGSLVQQSQEKPGPTLQKLLTQKPLGRFIKSKAAIPDAQLQSFLTSTSSFQDATEVKTLDELFVFLAKNFSPFKEFLQKNLLDETDISRICLWFQNLSQKNLVDLTNRDTIKKVSGIGADWSYGYTNNLDRFHVPQGSSPFPRVVGRDREVSEIENVLSKTSQNSVIAAGEPGVGRHAVVDEFARRLFEGNVPPDLVGFRAIYLDLKSALSGHQSPTDSRKAVLDLFEEGRNAGNIILVIDDIDKFFETGGERLDLTDILNQTLSDGKLRVIGLTSKQLADKYVLQNSSLLKLFSLVTVDQPDMETVFLEMELSIVPVLEKQHHVEISYNAIKEAVTDADRFISTVPFPEKAINILDETISFVKNEHPHMQMLWGSDVQRYLSTKNQIPLGNLEGSQKDKLANLETQLHQRIIGQDEAVTALSRAMRRAVLSVSARNKPIGTFLFLGPTGVGKTETAKALAQVYFGSGSAQKDSFGSDTRLVRFDMSEYQGEVGLERLLGSAKNNTPGQLTSAIINSPFAVVLLDEIEKTPPIISNLFLTLLDEGYITDAAGKRISARENIIIGTSNAGALFIKDRVEKNENLNSLSEDLIKYVQDEKIFSPEFLNRFDSVIVFRPLDNNQMKEVIKLMLQGVAKRLADKKITLEYTPELLDRIIQNGYNPSFGARSIRRYIQDTVEDEISQKLLTGNFPPGSTLKI